MLSALEIEPALCAAWPFLEIVRDGNWEARFANGYSGRSNSIQTFDASDDFDACRRIKELESLYEARGIVPAFKITPLTGTGVIAALDELGWAVWHQTLVMTMPLSGAWKGDHAVACFDPQDPQWLDHQNRLKSLSTRDYAALESLFSRLGTSAGLTLFSEDGTPAAAALAVCSGPYCAAFNVVTRDTLRRQGLGHRIMESLLSWGAGHGASIAAVQVQADNLAAISLYLSMGFRFRYPYHYRRPELA